MLGIRLASADDVLALRPDFVAMQPHIMGVIGPYDDNSPADYEVRAFAPGLDIHKDPVCGSVKASIAQWLLAEGIVTGDSPSGKEPSSAAEDA